MTAWNTIASVPSNTLVFLANADVLWPGWLTVDGYERFAFSVRADKQGQGVAWARGNWQPSPEPTPTHWYPLPTSRPPTDSGYGAWTAVGTSLPVMRDWVFVGNTEQIWVSRREGSPSNWSWYQFPDEFDLRLTAGSTLWLNIEWPGRPANPAPTHWVGMPDALP